MARDTMAALIEQLRGLADAGTADWTNGTAVFWDEDQLQQVLDRHRVDISREELLAVPQYGTAGAVYYYEYRSAFRNLEETDGGSLVLTIQDSEGNTVALAGWSADYARGIVTFTADTGGVARYLNARSFDLNAAAADAWRVKASNAAKLYDFSTDNHNLRRSQYMEHCLKMAAHFEKQMPVGVTTMYRSDVA